LYKNTKNEQFDFDQKEAAFFVTKYSLLKALNKTIEEQKYIYI